MSNKIKQRSRLKGWRHVGLVALLHLLFMSDLFAAEADRDKMVNCGEPALVISQNMIRFILDDLTKSYKQVGGGGIVAVKRKASFTFVISIAQEERVDQISYQLHVDKNCAISILHRENSALSPVVPNKIMQ